MSFNLDGQMETYSGPRPLRSFVATVVVVGAAALVFGGCLRTSAAPQNVGPTECNIDQRLPGIWTSARRSQLGSARMLFEFDCDCRYRSGVRLFLFMRVREEGRYWTSDGELSFSRATGEITSWPYRFQGGNLVLEEYPGEEEVYRRRAAKSCH